MAYPSTVKSSGDTITSADWNDFQDEILSMESLSQRTTVVYEDFMIIALPPTMDFSAVLGAPSPTFDTSNHEMDISTGTTTGGTGNVRTLVKAELGTVTSIEVECRHIFNSTQASDVGNTIGIVLGNAGTNGASMFPSSATQVDALTRSGGGDTKTTFTEDQTAFAVYNILATSAAVSFKVDGVEEANHTTNIVTTDLLNGIMAVRTGDTTDRTGAFDYFYMKVVD